MNEPPAQQLDGPTEGARRGIPGRRSRRPAQKTALLLFLCAIGLVITGCRTFGFYRQAIKGQYQIVTSQEKIETLIAEPQTPVRLKEKLVLVQKLRAFASADLRLPVDGHYQKYVDIHRPFVVWNVEAAPEFSLEPKTWWYPFVGRLDYRGYFAEPGATNYAQALRERGYDISVGGVAAYSTLGWFKDPVLNTFVFDPEPDLAETIFHELGHQRVFASGDAHFNEAFATIVGQEGAQRWLRAKGDTNACAAYQAELRRTDQFVALVAGARKELELLYGDVRTETGAIKANPRKAGERPPDLRSRKQDILDKLRRNYRRLRDTEWNGDGAYDAWFAHGLNNAKLNTVAQYYDLLPAFRRLLELNGNDLEKFYQASERLAKQPKKERDAALSSLAPALASTGGTTAKAPAN
jgi:predicted aminopeptidase